MIAVTGSIRPAHLETAALHVVEQAFRRSYPSVGIEPDQLIIRLDHWHVLLTTEPNRIRIDVVVGTRADAAAFQERFLTELTRWIFPGTLSTTWADSRYIPVPLR